MNKPLESKDVEDLEIQLLLEALHQRYHYDFRNYARASIRRRLVQAREKLGFASISGLQDSLLHDAAMLPRLLDYLTVQVSEMFRDPGYFRALRESVLPHLRTYPSLKVWVAGCSHGEELYSLAILFREEGLLERTIFYATDINPEALRIAQSGVYPLDQLRKFTETIKGPARAPRSPTTTSPTMGGRSSTRACGPRWCSPTTAWRLMRSSPRCIWSRAATC